MSPINSLSSSYMQSILGAAAKTSANSLSSTSVSALAQAPDDSQISPFAQVMSKLQQLQQTDPAKYQQVTQQIAANLQNAAKTAQSAGNTDAANQLNQLANDFTDASKSGQLPNMQDLAQAMGAHHHHHHRHAQAASANAATSDALNPTSIILETMSSAGIGTSGS